jgi:hypothetical protein
MAFNGDGPSSQPPTDNITVLSSSHGRKRRKQRAIHKRDLKKAVKYGTREPGNPGPDGRPRIKWSYDGVVYITDETGRQEITAWNSASLLPIAEMPEDDGHHMQTHLISTRPSAVSSHTVVVVDMSGSMRAQDVGEYRGNRAQAVYENLALLLVKEQLAQKAKAMDRTLDIVSLIEMRDDAEVIFESMPLDGNLFNMLVKRRDLCRPSSHGNYIPSLAAAERLLNKFSHGGCALRLLFLSDGRPSDEIVKGQVKLQGPHGKILHCVQGLTQKFGRRLNIGTIGFASERQDFSVLEKMAETSKTFSTASYQYARVDLASAISSLVTSFTSTKVEMTSADGLAMRTVRNLTRELPFMSLGSTGWKKNDVWYYVNYGGNDNRYVRQGADIVTRWRYSERHERLGGDGWEAMPMMHPAANGLVIRKSIFGEGAERVVYALREALIEGWHNYNYNPCKTLLGQVSIYSSRDLLFPNKTHPRVGSTVLSHVHLSLCPALESRVYR